MPRLSTLIAAHNFCKDDVMTEQVLQLVPAELPEPFRAGLEARITSGKLHLPLLPDVVMEVLNLSNSDDADARKLAGILHRDQTMAGHVLRVANSPAYKPSMPIVSLTQAVNRLGMKLLCEIAYTVSLQNQAFRVVGYEREVKMLWRHAVSTGFYAREIARLQGYDAGKAFLWGLLHDMGKPVVLHALSQLQKDLESPLALEAAIGAMDAYHVQVGGLLAESWELPVMVKECIKHHHDYLNAPTCKEAAMVTCLADVLSYLALADEPDDAKLVEVRTHPVVSHLHCSPAHLDTLFGKRDDAIQMMDTMDAAA